MDSYKCVLTVYTVITICLVASGTAEDQWGEGDGLDSRSMVARRSDWRDSYDVDNDWGALDSNQNNEDGTEKRSYVSDGYQRYPRIKQIIPFYSYRHRHVPGYRPRPRYYPRQRGPTGYKSWNRNDYFSRVLNRGPPIYGGY